MKKLVLLLPLVMVLAACTSAKKRAAEYLERSEFDQAITTYDSILRRKPGDAEALEGLAKARQGKISQQLIEVRRARLGGDPNSGANLLLGVLRLEAQWGTGPSGPAAFSQNEEIEFAQGHLSAQIKQSVEANRPLHAKIALSHFEPILQKRADALKPAVDRKGKESCQGFVREVRSTSAAYADFVRRYCALFGAKGVQDAKLNDQRLATLFRAIKVSGEIEALDDVMKLQASSHLASVLQEALQQTAWYDPAGKQTAPGQLTGVWSMRKTRETIDVDHPYTVQVSYQELVPVEKTRRVSYLDASGATLYRDENYIENTMVTKNRADKRIYRYTANEHKQTLKVALSVAVDLNGHALTADAGGTQEDRAIEHAESKPAWGLTPAVPKLPVPLDWLKSKQAELATQLKKKATDLWIATYCTAVNADAGIAATGEQVHQCLRQVSDPVPASVSQWYADHLGVRGEELTRALVLLGYRKT